MSEASAMPVRRAEQRGGFTLVEAALSILIVGGMLVAAMSTLAASRLGERTVADRARAAHLAGELMEEILPLPYADPRWEQAGPIGPEGDEAGGPRSAFNDVDDYHGWQASPPQDRHGNALSGLEGWTRRVRVAWVSPTDLDQVMGSETGVKRITVEVLHGQLSVARLEAIRTDGESR